MTLNQQEYHRTGRPVIVRPITRRWISDVPSKMVKILGADFSAQFRRIYAGKWADSVAGGGQQRPTTAPDGPALLPDLLPAGSRTDFALTFTLSVVGVIAATRGVA